ncbi:Signal transduction histidine-protein kinase BarA [compost metagenome]
MKVTYTKTLARKTLLTFLVFVIILAVAALFVRNAITKKLEDISKLASNIEHRLKPEQALLLLHQAEDDFQESLLDINGPKSNDYKVKLTLAFNKIDTLLNTQTDTTQLTAAQGNQVKVWYKKKLELSNRLFELKHNFDSLLTVYAQFNGQANLTEISTNLKTSKKKFNTKTDTIRKAISVEKKGLFGRLKDAISNKQGTATGVVEINHNTNTAELATQKIIARNKVDNARKLQELQQHNVKMLSMQRELISLNANITNELERIVNDLKDINYKMADELKGMAFKNYQETTSLLNKFYLAALFLVLLFAALLIIFIFQLNKSELQLLKENERSVNIARQKMELLTHMTHEIRNPLTTIKGFLYIFAKTTLTQRQTDMLESIKGSSDMLLRTLNDTLDAAKMETSELKIESDPFNPNSTINQVIESMSYSATKKKLELSYNFKGDTEAIVLGDAFRLKQIMVNLVSNAIKYTNEGKVTINAELLPDDTRLQVDIIDTGMGISPDQQANLFSQYYQTNSAKGQIGTGLGLYICKQLVEMQKGKISVKSELGVGTTFSFFIPYPKA